MATENQSLDEIYVRVGLDDSQLKKGLTEDQKKAEASAKKMEDAFNKSKAQFKVKYDDALAKKSIKDLQILRKHLQAEFDKKVKLNVDAKSLDYTRTQIAAIDQKLQGVNTTAVQSTGSASKLMGVFAAAGGLILLFRNLKDAIAGAFTQARAEAGVEQAVRRTGEAAGYTAKQLFYMASALQDITGTGDEEILKGVTKQLLTFTQITGSSFRRAQEAVLDLNAVINDGEVSSLTSQSIQLGKALEDPIRGVSALARAGVTFTDEQKKMIAGFIRQNDLLGAQNIILTEIENKYGGQAKALAEASKGTLQASASFGDMLEAIGALIINIPGLTFVLTNFTGGIKTITQWLQGANYEINNFKRSLDDLRSASFDVSTTDLEGKTKEYRESLKKFNEELLAANKLEIDEKKKQLEIEAKKVRFSDDEINNITERIKVLERSNAVANGELKALENMEKRIARVNEKWTAQGKTIGEIQDRIDFLNDVKINYVPGDKELDKINSEIEGLQKKIDNTNQKKLEPSADTKYLNQLTGALDGYREKIKILNDELARLGSGGNEEKRLILTAELSKLQKQLEDAEFSIGLKVDFKAGDLDTSSLQDAFAIDVNNNIAKELEANLALRLKAHQEFIDSLGILNETAYNDAVEKINAETEAYIQAGVSREEAQIIHNAKMKDLEDARAKEQEEIRNLQLENIAAVGSGLKGFSALAEQLFGKQSAAYKAFAISEATIATYLAATKALETVPFPFNFAASAGVVAAGLANVAQITSAHQGGNFIGTNSGVKKMNQGGSFVVPPGYPNDSFPMLVETNEKVRVTPAGKTDPLEISLAALNNRVDALANIFLSKDFSPTIVNNMSLNGRTISREVANEIIKMQKEGRKF